MTTSACKFVLRFASGMLLLFVFASTFPALAQTGSGNAAATAAGQSSALSSQQPIIAGLVKKISDLNAQIASASHADSKLTDLRLALQKAAADLQNATAPLATRVTEIDGRLKQLGNPPAAGAPPEAANVTAERNRLTAEKSQVDALIAQANGSVKEAGQAADKISEMRRDLFAKMLSRRFDLDYSLNLQTLLESRQQANRLGDMVSSWVSFVAHQKLLSFLGATGVAFAIALVFLVGGRRVFGHLIAPDSTKTDVSYLTRLSVAFWSTFLPSLALAAFLFIALYFYDYFGVLNPDIESLLIAVSGAISTMFFFYRLTYAVVSPGLPHWRLLAVAPHAGRVLLLLSNATALAVTADFTLGRVNQILHSPLALTVAKSFFATVAVGVLVILIGLVKPFSDEDGRPKRWPAPFRYFLFFLGGVTAVAALLGYIGLARFLSQQIVITSSILITMYIGFLSARAVAQEGAFRDTSFGRRLKDQYHLDDTTLDQLALAISILINLLILCWGIPLILLQWRFHWADIVGWTYNLASNIRIGSVTFSLTGIATGIIIFAIGYFISRWFQNWIDGSVMSRSRVDAGVRNSIRTGVGYMGFAVAALIGISVAGINLSSLALVAGALSLGIGFGLQNIVSNFVSGLILLVERPIKVGDWIVAGSVSGIVKKISVRATEIETFQRQSVILPNSELINSAVGNWTLHNRLARIEIKVGVAYGSDVRKVHKILTDIAEHHPSVLKNPAPFVLFAGFGDSSLDFEVRIYLADVMAQITVQNDIRFAIVDAFAAEKIEIPFPQRDVWIRKANTANTDAKQDGVDVDPEQGYEREG